MTEGALTTSDGIRLFTRAWTPPAPPRATILIVHGYAEHSGRYGHLAARFIAAGFEVHAFDHRGFGRSEGRRGLVRLDVCLRDLDQMIRHVRAHAASPDLIVLGHSMGGGIAALYSITQQPDLAGLMLSSPALSIPILPVLHPLALAVGRLLPGLPTIPLDRRGLSHDPDVVQQAEEDPLNFHGGTPAGTAASIIRTGRSVLAQVAQLTVPFLVTHGTADPISDPRGSERLYERAGATDKTLSLFEGFYHETFNEPDGRLVLDTMTDWLEEHTPAPPNG